MSDDLRPDFAIEFDPRAIKELGKLDRQTARRVKTAIDALALNPRPIGAKPLVGYTQFWRVRVGDFRVIYTIEDSRVTVLIIHIAHRREVYRSL